MYVFVRDTGFGRLGEQAGQEVEGGDGWDFVKWWVGGRGGYMAGLLLLKEGMLNRGPTSGEQYR